MRVASEFGRGTQLMINNFHFHPFIITGACYIGHTKCDLNYQRLEVGYHASLENLENYLEAGSNNYEMTS